MEKNSDLQAGCFGGNFSYQSTRNYPFMSTAVKKTISLPPDLAKEAEDIARSEGKTVSAVIQDALRRVRTARLKRELKGMQDYWSRRAKENGILTEKDLQRYLGE